MRTGSSSYRRGAVLWRPTWATDRYRDKGEAILRIAVAGVVFLDPRGSEPYPA
jgi:hypothetical protein